MSQQKKIAVLEGNAEVGRQIADRLREDGFEVCTVTDNGREGIERIEEEKPDIVIVGMVLKETDGFGVLERLKDDKSPAQIIATGSFSDDEIISRVLAKGAKYYLMKPVPPELVAERAKELVGLSGAEIKTSAPREKKNAASLDEKISNIFISIGIPAHIKGYQFLREAVKLAVEEPEIISSITKKLYPTIAERFETSSSKVERGMRHAIEVAWNRGKIENINNIFGLKI